MLYRVQGRLREEKREEFFRVLTDGTVREQRPDGREIVASMRRAVLRGDGWAEWTETCYCPTPLKHERATVYDRFFEEIEAKPIEAPDELQGPSFWRYLEGGSRG